jgi:hypothetical protein
MEEPHNFHMVPQLFLGECCSPCVVALKFTKKVNFVGTSLGKKKRIDTNFIFYLEGTLIKKFYFIISQTLGPTMEQQKRLCLH